MTDVLQGINVYLIGMMGAGKTTVGRLLAQHLGYGFLDTDDVITKASSKSINEIFASVGESGFRQIESHVLQQVCAYTKLAIATGGGIIIRRENWGYLRHGLVVWLDVPIDLLCGRLAEDTTRPLLQDSTPKEKLRSLLEQRTPLYSQADLHINITEGETPESISQRIMDAIPSVLKRDNSQNSQN
jgi:shikimate kinase